MEKINIILKNSKEKKSFSFNVEKDITVEQLKYFLEKEKGVTEIKIIYQSQILDDKKTFKIILQFFIVTVRKKKQNLK